MSESSSAYRGFHIVVYCSLKAATNIKKDKAQNALYDWGTFMGRSFTLSPLTFALECESSERNFSVLFKMASVHSEKPIKNMRSTLAHRSLPNVHRSLPNVTFEQFQSSFQGRSSSASSFHASHLQ